LRGRAVGAGDGRLICVRRLVVAADASEQVRSDRVEQVTDWLQILQLYDQLMAIAPSPIVALNRAVAVAEVDGPEVALALVDDLELDGYLYEDFAAFWPNQPQPNPFTDVLNRSPKYVASRTLSQPLAWENSTLLQGDVGRAVAELKARSEKDIVVLGSGDLIQTLIRHDLVDEYVLLIHPLVLGTGRRLFADGGPPATLRLVDTKITTTGVIIATYRPAERTTG